MSKFIFIGNEIIFTNKARCLFELDKQGLNIPLTIILSDLNNFSKVLSYFPSSESIYLRVNYSDTIYPHYEFKICNLSDLEVELKTILSLLNKNNIFTYDIIIQEMINLSWSGVALNKGDITLVEVVYGNLSYLLRDGIFLQRFFIDKSLTILKTEKGNQSQYKTLANNELILKSSEGLKIDEKILFDSIPKLCMDFTLYEFGCTENNMVFLESKAINKDAYLNIETTKLKKKPFIIFKDINFNLAETVSVDLPIFDHIASVNKSLKYQVLSGPFLSHFTTYLANNCINSFY